MRRASVLPSPRPLLVSARADTVTAVLDRIPSPARPEVAVDIPAARRLFAAAPRVLVAADLLSPLADAGVVRRSEIALLLPAGEPDPDPRSCVALGIEQVLELAEGAAWLSYVESSGGRFVAVTGARGGCGVSTLAGALALSAAAQGSSVLLVDLDLLGGGLDVLLGAEQLPGARWPDLCEEPVRGNVFGDLFVDLPTVGNLRVLAAGQKPTEPPPDLVRAALRQAADVFDMVVVDLPRGRGDDVLPETGVVLLVVPDEIRAGAAAATRLAGFPTGRDVRIVVREGVSGEPALETADRLGCPLAGRFRSESRLAELAERGLVRPSRSRSPLWRLADRLLGELWADPR